MVEEALGVARLRCGLQGNEEEEGEGEEEGGVSCDVAAAW